MKGKLEVRSNDPSEDHPLVFKLRDLIEADATLTDVTLEVFIEWHSGTYGSRVPVVVVRAPK